MKIWSEEGLWVPLKRDDHYWMGLALREAARAERLGEVPIGAVVIRGGQVIGRGYNLRESRQDPAAHAEMIALRKASSNIWNWRITGATMYVTLEPCIMCTGALLLARVERVVFGCFDPKGGACGSLYDLSNDQRLNHRMDVSSGVREGECAAMLKEFFAGLRTTKRKNDETYT